MTYLEQLKEKETKLMTLKAQILAKKQAAEETLAKRDAAEKEAQSKFGLSLSEIPAQIENDNKKLEELNEKLQKEIENIENEFTKLKC